MNRSNNQNCRSMMAQLATIIQLVVAAGCGAPLDEDTDSNAAALSSEGNDDSNASELPSDAEERDQAAEDADSVQAAEDADSVQAAEDADGVHAAELRTDKKCDVLGNLALHFKTYDTMANGGSADNIVSFADLVAARKKEDTKHVANYLISRPELWARLDVADLGDDPDGKMSRADLNAYRHHHCNH